MTKKIDALLLSAGKSSRMGFTKALVDWDNQKLIQFQVETLLSSGCNNVFIVLGHEKEKIIPYIQKENTKRTSGNICFYPSNTKLAQLDHGLLVGHDWTKIDYQRSWFILRKWLKKKNKNHNFNLLARGKIWQNQQLSIL